MKKSKTTNWKESSEFIVIIDPPKKKEPFWSDKKEKRDKYDFFGWLSKNDLQGGCKAAL